MNKNWILSIACTVFVSLVLTTSANAQVITAFSNDFEDGDIDPEVGTMTLVEDSAVASVVPVANGGNDAILGNNVGFFDQGTVGLDLTLNLTDTLSLADGDTVTIDLDFAARRTNGISRSIFVDALDSNGDMVTRIVLGDSAIFGNGGNDRQRPGFATSADGNQTFGTPPGSFWWGADTNSLDFNPAVDAHISVTIGESTFDFSTERTVDRTFSGTGFSNFSGGPSANIAAVRLTNFVTPTGITIHGAYYDNIIVTGVVATDVVPEVLLGDSDLNGEVNFSDIPAFISVLQNGIFQAQSDTNEDGAITFSDIPFFIAILQNL